MTVLSREPLSENMDKQFCMQYVEGMEHKDKIAIVTGGARGFGFGFAQALCAAGATVVILDRDGDEARRVANSLSADGASCSAVSCDVSDEQAVDSAVAHIVETLGGVNILINNAGLLANRYSTDFSIISRADVRAVLEVNVMGVINCSVAVRSAMARRGGGVILNLASIAGYTIPGPYGLSKLAVRGLTVSLAREFAPDNIRVNAVAPGLMATESVMADLPSDMVGHFINDLQLLKRQGLPGDIVDAAMFLCSDKASFITGETLRVSGGFPLEV
ncbi:MAG: SDR family NAD(P)-dependent oxidoreductase [Sphingobium phenoxybenzoativorans]